MDPSLMPRLQDRIGVARIVPATHTVEVLIGRDILAHGTLLFDGENQIISLWF
jgi:hypothetical protein